MLLISKTYEIISEESAENGDVEESGFEWENQECSISEIVDTIRNLEPSQWPITHPESVWFTEYGDADYETGDIENSSFHYSRKNPSKNLKHWIAAIKLAGFKIKE